MSGQPGFVFLSYGHDGFAPRAERLKADLMARGYDVWFDKERLKPGVDWEAYIDDGISRAKAAGDKGKFVLLMTPHSVRRDEGGRQNGGFCLNELARAVDQQLFIVPIMMDWCEPPLSIFRIQWLDMRECFPPEQRPAAYENAFARLVDALETRRLDFDGIATKLSSTLRPLDFGERLRRYLPRFIGRQWIFAKLDRWLDDQQGSRILWLTGRPGVGKSALAAWYSQNRRATGAIHFCRSGQTETTDARRAVQSIAFQLSSQFPQYKDALNLVDFGALAQANAATWFDTLLIQKLPQENPRPNTLTLIVIDGLDEATKGNANALANLIAEDFRKTPDWLRLLVTSRPEAGIKSTLQGLTPEILTADAKENLDDSAAFIQKEYARFSKTGTIPPETVKEILKRSEGLFLYLERLLEELELGRRSLEDVDSFPQGLGEVFDQYFKRQFPDDAAYSGILPALEAIVAAREPLKPDFLRTLLSWDDYQLRDARAALGSMFMDLAGRFQPFHKTVIEWLTDSEKADRYFVSRAAGENRFAKAGEAVFETRDAALNPYFVKFLADHLAAANRRDALEHLLLTYTWMQAKLRATDAFTLNADYRLMPGVANQPATIVGETLQLSARALAWNPGELPSQLHGRLLGFDQPEIRQLLKQAAIGPNGLWLKPRTADLTPPGTALVATISESGEGIRCAALSPDGSEVIFANGADVKRWKPFTAEAPISLCEAPGAQLAVSPDGRHLAVSSEGGSVSIWPLDVESDEGPLVFSGGPEKVAAIAFSNHGTELTVVSATGEVQAWNVTEAGSHMGAGSQMISRAPIAQALAGENREACALAGEAAILFVSAASVLDPRIEVWDLTAGLSVGSMSGEVGLSRLAVTPGADLVAAGSTSIQIWRRSGAKPELLRTLRGHEFMVSALAISANGRRLVSATIDTVHLWDLERAGETDFTGRAKAWPRNISFDSAAGRACVFFSDRSAKTYDLNTLKQADVPLDPPETIAQTSDGARELIVLEKKLTLRETATGRVAFTFPLDFDPTKRSAALYPDGSRAVIGTEYSITVWDLDSGQMIQKLEGQFCHGPPVAVAATPYGRRIAAPAEDNSVLVWDAENFALVRTLRGHRYSVWSTAFLPGGTRLMTAGGDGTLVIWNLSTGREEAVFTADAGIRCSACTPDGKRIVAGDLAGQLHFLDVVEASPPS